MRINDVLKGKPSHDVITISPGRHACGSWSPCCRSTTWARSSSACDGETVDGIVSERDVVRRLHDRADVLDRPSRTIMTADVRTCEGTEPLTELMQVMTEHRIRHVPVLTDGKLTGIISIGDVVKNRIGELEFERDQLDSYVHQT